MANRHERRAGKAQQRRPRHPTAPHLAVVPNLLNNEWDTFREMVLAPDAPDIQLSEMRRAFFGGAAALFKVMMRKLDPGEEPTKRDEAQMERSDEHTSELQSLMRTSYAVFCCRKKNHDDTR